MSLFRGILPTKGIGFFFDAWGSGVLPFNPFSPICIANAGLIGSSFSFSEISFASDFVPDVELSSTGAKVAVVHCCFFRLSSSSFFLAISASCLCFNLSLIEAKVGSILTGPGSAFLGFHSSKLIFDSTSVEFLFSISRSLSSSSLLRFSEFLFSRSDLPDPLDLSDCFDLDLFDLERDLDLDFLDFDGDLLYLATGRDCDLDLDLDLDLDFDLLDPRSLDLDLDFCLLDPRSLDFDLDFDLLETDSDSDLR